MAQVLLLIGIVCTMILYYSAVYQKLRFPLFTGFMISLFTAFTMVSIYKHGTQKAYIQQAYQSKVDKSHSSVKISVTDTTYIIK